MATWAIANQKGGVGKTAVTLGLAAAAAKLGAKVLVIDLDPQASASKVLGIEDQKPDVSDLLLATGTHAIGGVVSEVPTWGIDLAPSDLRLARLEQNRGVGVEQKLRRSLDASGYDVVLIDCPPSLGILTINALVAAQHVLIVTTPSYAAMRGLSDLLLGAETIDMGVEVHEDSTIEAVRESYNDELEVAGFVLNLDEHTTDARGHAQDLRLRFGTSVWDPGIPKRAAMAASYTTGLPLYALDPNKGGGRQLILCFEEVAKRLLAHQVSSEPPVSTNDAAFDGVEEVGTHG